MSAAAAAGVQRPSLGGVGGVRIRDVASFFAFFFAGRALSGMLGVEASHSVHRVAQ